MLTSHPFAALPSQLPNPALHAAIPHAPLLQAGVPLDVAHMKPQAPQLRTSELMLVSHPFAELPSQLAKPAEQNSAHTPLVHTPDWFGPPPQTAPHAPQF